MNRIAAVVAAVSLAFVGTSATFAEIHWVCPSGCPFTSIQDAIDAANDGDTIQISIGTYNEHSLNTGGKAITIRGALNGDGTLATTIDAQQGGSVFVFKSGETSDTVISNLELTGGTGTSVWWGVVGGGIYCRDNSSPTISGCTISGNTAYVGGGIACESNSSPTITNCTIQGNTASQGGGINTDSNCNPTITGCTISGNTASNHGGGIYCLNSNPTISGCEISGNTASNHGGGIFCWGSNPTITNCTISDNTAAAEYAVDGGGIYCLNSNPTISDCTIEGNTANSDGGGIYCYNSSPVHSGCTFSSNSPDNVYGDSDWNPAPGGRGGRGDGDDEGPSIITIENCTIFGTGEHIAGNIPILHLGENHIHDGIDDGDLDGDGDVDVDDLNMHHGTVGICMSDVNHDFATDVLDLLVVIDGWGSVCP